MKMFNEKNPMWKGNDVGYTALHEWVKRRLPKPILCEICYKNKSYELINLSHKYKRDLSDWKWSCRSCHNKYDNKIQNINGKEYKKKCIICGKRYITNIYPQLKQYRENRSDEKRKIIRTYDKKWKRQQSIDRISQNLCIKCGKNKPIKGLKNCKKCNTYYKKYDKKRKHRRRNG